MIIVWTDGNGFLYEGDCRPGDREATPAEAAAYLQQKDAALIKVFMANFIADRDKMIVRISSMMDDAKYAEDTTSFDILIVFKEDLIALTKLPSITSQTTLVGVKAALKTEYDAIRSYVPIPLLLKFKDFDK